jgi:multisubunit Na+/H+ antiporter MnhE subunit
VTRFLLSLIGLTLVYSMFLLSSHPWDLTAGMILAAGMLLLFRRHLFVDSRQAVPKISSRLIALIHFAWYVYVDTIQGLWQVLVIVTGLRPLARPGIVAIPIGQRTRTGVAVTAWAVTLSPGSVLIDVDWERREMLFHFIDATEPEKLRKKLQVFYQHYQQPVFP